MFTFFHNFLYDADVFGGTMTIIALLAIGVWAMWYAGK